MADQDIITRETLEQQPFIDRHWLFYNALRRETVLEYFSLSKFYDRRSCNEELRMQGAKDIRLEHLGDMTGVQFVAEEVEGPTTGQPIFVIKKVLRSSRTKLQVLDVYYVLDGMIYQAPTILSVLNARLRRCAFMLNRAQSTLSRCVGFEMGQGDMYRLRRSLPVGGGGGEAREEEMMMDIDAHRSQGRKGGKEGVPSSLRYPSVLAVPVPHPEGHQAVERVLLHLIEEYPAPTPASHIEKDRRSMMDSLFEANRGIPAKMLRFFKINPFAGAGTSKAIEKDQNEAATCNQEDRTITLRSSNDDYPLYAEGLRLLDELQPLLLRPEYSNEGKQAEASSASSELDVQLQTAPVTFSGQATIEGQAQSSSSSRPLTSILSASTLLNQSQKLRRLDDSSTADATFSTTTTSRRRSGRRSDSSDKNRMEDDTGSEVPAPPVNMPRRGITADALKGQKRQLKPAAATNTEAQAKEAAAATSTGRRRSARGRKNDTTASQEEEQEQQQPAAAGPVMKRGGGRGLVSPAALRSVKLRATKRKQDQENDSAGKAAAPNDNTTNPASKRPRLASANASPPNEPLASGDFLRAALQTKFANVSVPVYPSPSETSSFSMNSPEPSNRRMTRSSAKKTGRC